MVAGRGHYAIHPERGSQGRKTVDASKCCRRCASNNAPGGCRRSGRRCGSCWHRVRPCACKWPLRVPLTHPVTSRSLAKNVDGIYRESSLVKAQLARGSPDDVSGPGESRYKSYDAFGSGGASYERAVRAYSETARMTTGRKSSTFVVIASICLVSIPATILISF
jgi:hypothetical protein